METYFAPPQRTDRRKFKNQIETISHSPLMDSLLKAVSGLLIVLNEDRQIVGLNHAVLDALGVKDVGEVLGLRLGESLKCVHAAEDPNGCGTTAHCVTCGAAIAMMAAINDDEICEQSCALTTEAESGQQDTCLLIRAQPLMVEENRWILIFAQDITQQQFWVTLERIFFHDINNMLTTLLGNSEMLTMNYPYSNEAAQIRRSAVRLCSEIALQRSLSQHKDAKYLARKEEATINDIRREVDLIVHGHQATIGKHLSEQWPNDEVPVFTDVMLASRVIGNMLINALEATDMGGGVRLITEIDNGHAVWQVWNDACIPQEIRLRIFQRHFSTKSRVGRGLGTYSMKLFGEGYLKGQVTFESNRTDGTVFTFRLPLTTV